MPIYEYYCNSCSHELETLQKVSDDPLIYCPECGEGALRKKVSAAAFRLKGTGWYETDFKDKGKKGESKDKGAEKSDSGGSGDTASKPDAKSDSSSGSKDSSSESKPKSEKKSDTPPAKNSGSASASPAG